jgi:tRNA-dihydrouridine synthase A
MIGRAAYEDVWLLAAADARIWGEDHPGPSRREAIHDVLGYAERVCREGEPVSRVTRHLVNLFRGVPGARAWRRHLSERAHRPGAGPDVIAGAMERVPDAVLDERPYALAAAS